MHRHNTIVLRNSDNETTFADVSCNTFKEMDDHELRMRVSIAVNKWIKETKEGKEAWEASSEDFNIGDLVDHLGDMKLKVCLKDYGVYRLEIDTHSFEAYQPTLWSYDDVLGQE